LRVSLTSAVLASLLFRSVPATLSSPSSPTRRSSDLDTIAVAIGETEIALCRRISRLCFGFDFRDHLAAVFIFLRAHRNCDKMITDRKSTRLNSSHEWILYSVFFLKIKKHNKSFTI